MNILFITPSFPSRLHRIRTFHLLSELSKAHAIYLVSLTPSLPQNKNEISLLCKEIHTVRHSLWRSLFSCARYVCSPLPLEVAYCRNKRMNAAIQAILKRTPIDVMYIKRMRSAQFIDPDISIPCLLDTTDAMSLLYHRMSKSVSGLKKLLYKREEIAYRRYEKKCSSRFTHWITCSPLDSAELQKHVSPHTRFSCIPNGVDARWYYTASTPPRAHSLVFSGLMDKFVNIEAAEYLIKKIFSRLRQQFPDTVLTIVGPNPPRAITKYASDNIIITGHAADIRQHIAHASVVVCPILTGAGTRNKILQAWSMGRPVVSTSQGIEGLGAKNNYHALVRDTPKGFAQAIAHIFEDKEYADRIARNARMFVEARYDLPMIGRTLERCIKTCLETATIPEIL